ncbi:MAG: peroxide stress protein YaaA [Leucobacter sp.]
MLVLLPPSETKRSGGSSAFDPATLRAPEALGAARERVRAALVELSRDEEAAAKPLKLGVKNRGELLHNLELDRSGALPAVDRYTGVLYDALDAPSLGGEARSWLETHVLVQSALFGLIRAADPIPAYRLSAASRLPALGASLKRVWVEAHATLDWSGAGLILDLRSKDYAALAAVPGAIPLDVVQRAADGEVRALNHFNKAAKGDLVRRLALAGESFEQVEEMLGWAASSGLEMTASRETGGLVLVTDLGAPKTPGVLARASSSNAGPPPR